MSEVKQYLRFRRVPVPVQKRVIEYYDHKYQRKFFNEQSLLSENNISGPLKHVSHSSEITGMHGRIICMMKGQAHLIVKLLYIVYFLDRMNLVAFRLCAIKICIFDSGYCNTQLQELG